MQVTPSIDENLLAEAMKASGIDTLDAVLNFVLKEYVQKNNQKKILKYRGTNIWEGDIEEMRSAR